MKRERVAGEDVTLSRGIGVGMRKLSIAVLITVTFSGCNCGGGMGDDAGVDAGVVDGGGSITRDAGVAVDAGVDAGVVVDAGVADAGFDAGVADAGFDAGVTDAGFDAGVVVVDAGFDAGVVVDAGFDAGVIVDAGIDAGVGADAGCSFGSAASLAVPGMLDLFGQISYFGDGGVLPGGRYVVRYVDGCMKYGGGQDWTIHAYASGSIAWWLVGASSNIQYLMPPGTVGYAASNGAYVQFADCVAANLLLPSIEFDFDGGVLGVWLQDSPYSDNLAGEGGRNPSWQLTRLGGCGLVE